MEAGFTSSLFRTVLRDRGGAARLVCVCRCRIPELCAGGEKRDGLLCVCACVCRSRGKKGEVPVVNEGGMMFNPGNMSSQNQLGYSCVTRGLSPCKGWISTG